MQTSTTAAVDIRPEPEAPSEPSGLTTERAEQLLREHGENALPEVHESPLKKLLATLWGPIPWMIEIAAILSAAVGHWEDFGIILSMLVINSGVRFWEEHKADRAIEALRANLAPTARVLRDGKWSVLPARVLVPGDVVRVKLGDIVPADVKLAEGAYLSVDQSALTGESLPVDRGPGDEAYSGSIVRMGEMTAVVTGTGRDTFFGKTVQLVQSARTVSHFQQAVLKIGNVLIATTLVLVALILVVALFRGAPWVETLLFAMILTVAAIPVALPAVLSVTMAVGASRLAQAKAIVSRLVSIEEMAGMDVLCSDKTGTLTKNELTVDEPVVFAAEDAEEVKRMAALVSKEGEGDSDRRRHLALAGRPLAGRGLHRALVHTLRSGAQAGRGRGARGRPDLPRGQGRRAGDAGAGEGGPLARGARLGRGRPAGGQGLPRAGGGGERGRRRVAHARHPSALRSAP